MDETVPRDAGDDGVAAASIDLAAIPDIDHYELEGIPVYHLPMAGPTVLSLSFRVGRADEPVIHGGLTHLAEHLILSSINDIFDHGNGTTEPFRVTFVARGTPQEASQFLRDVGVRIENPRLARMHQEAKVLRTEAAGRGGMGLSLRLVWLRTGFQGIGTVHLPEFFLDALDENRLRGWMQKHLVAGNAAIWIAGELPDDLDVILPAGPRVAPPEARSIDGFETPTVFMADAPGVGVSFEVRRSTAVVAALRAVNRQLMRRLRVDRGLGYEIGGEYLPVGPNSAFATVWATCLPDAARDVQQIVLETIDDVAARGPSPADLSRDHQLFLRELSDPRSIPGRLDAHVRDMLLGDHPSPRPIAEIIDERWRLEPDEVATAFRDVRDTMLLLLPMGGVDPQRPFKRYPGPSSAAMGVVGVFDYAAKEKRRFRRDASIVRLSVGSAGVSVDAVDGRRLTAVTWADCVVMVRGRGVRSIIGRDGNVVEVVAAEWRGGDGAIRLLDQLGPKAVFVDPA